MFTIRRAFAAAAIAAALVAAVPTSAGAAPADGLTFTVHDMGVSPGGKLGSVDLRAGQGAPAQLTNVEVVLDSSDIAGFATVFPADLSGDKPKPLSSCTTHQQITTCPFGTMQASNFWLLPNLWAAATQRATVGEHGTLTVTLKSDQVTLVAKPTITVADDVDLVAGPHSPTVTAEPGAAVDQPIEITNNGTKSVPGAAVQFVFNDQGLEPGTRYSNCSYVAADDHVLFCKFDEVLAPLTTYRISDPVFQVRKQTPAGGVYFYAHFWDTGDDAAELGDDWYGGAQVTPGTGPALHLVPAPASSRDLVTDSNPQNSFAFGYVDTPAGTSPSASGTAPGGATATATASASSSTAPGGGLPVTGSNVMLAAGAGAALLAIGGVLFVVTRRRRTSFTA